VGSRQSAPGHGWRRKICAGKLRLREIFVAALLCRAR
jgi:hypothetical protein